LKATIKVSREDKNSLLFYEKEKLL